MVFPVGEGKSCDSRDQSTAQKGNGIKVKVGRAEQRTRYWYRYCRMNIVEVHREIIAQTCYREKETPTNRN